MTFIQALYYQRHENVCVMFASIPNFKTFWSEWDFSKKLECLRFLNEIVCDFDKFLQKPKFSGVEKIKTVGSTYMAAAGLRSQNSQESWRSAKLMVEFAWAITNSLDALNKDAFQCFQLRIGLSFGPVIAGVVAAQKPQYDIFGNTVNLASRMDTHGEMGKMHATEETADALAIAGFDLECRGLIKVKGVKDPMKTYFVIPPPDRKITSCESEIIHHD
uniref:adenylate cyclase n=1 Tax=Romanomermis culicivorax TaxID=13658 RepID=A0A915J7K6_ROMCU